MAKGGVWVLERGPWWLCEASQINMLDAIFWLKIAANNNWLSIKIGSQKGLLTAKVVLQPANQEEKTLQYRDIYLYSYILRVFYKLHSAVGSQFWAEASPGPGPGWSVRLMHHI